MRATVMEVDLNAFRYNINSIKQKIGNGIEIMPIIKANAYGTYINTRLDILEEFNIVAVATVDEGVFIRKLGYTKDIFVLNQPYITEIDDIMDNNLIVGISSNNFLKALGNDGREVKVHIEIGTGMGRTGIRPSRIEEYVKEVGQYKNIIIDGIYTHLSSPDIDKEYTNKQLDSFEKAVNYCKENLSQIRYIHASASNAILNFNEAKYNLVRPGIIIYGYESSKGALGKIDLKPVCKLKSKIILLKTVKEGTSIGYGRSYITKRETKVATIPIGYADGFRRCLSNDWYVYINGNKCPIIGNICMDSFMADVTEIENVNEGDEVIIWDNENIKLEEIAQKCGTINYEIMSTISSRVPRYFVSD